MKKHLFAFVALAAALAITPAALADTLFNFSFEGTASGASDTAAPFNATGNFSVTGSLTATEIGTSDDWDIDSLTGTFTDTENGLDVVGAPITLIPISDGTYVSELEDVQGYAIDGYYSPDMTEIYDNVLQYPAATDSDYFDAAAGLLFSADGYEVSITQGKNDDTAGAAWVSTLGCDAATDNSSGTDHTDSNSPCWADYGDMTGYSAGESSGAGFDYGVPLNLSVDPVNSVPEGGAPWLYLLLAGACCFGGMFLSRNQNRGCAGA